MLGLLIGYLEISNTLEKMQICGHIDQIDAVARNPVHALDVYQALGSAVFPSLVDLHETLLTCT